MITTDAKIIPHPTIPRRWYIVRQRPETESFPIPCVVDEYLYLDGQWRFGHFPPNKDDALYDSEESSMKHLLDTVEREKASEQ